MNLTTMCIVSPSGLARRKGVRRTASCDVREARAHRYEGSHDGLETKREAERERASLSSLAACLRLWARGVTRVSTKTTHDLWKLEV